MQLVIGLENFEHFAHLVMYFRSLNSKSILPALSGWLKIKDFQLPCKGEGCSKTEIRIEIEQSGFLHLESGF